MLNNRKKAAAATIWRIARSFQLSDFRPFDGEASDSNQIFIAVLDHYTDEKEREYLGQRIISLHVHVPNSMKDTDDEYARYGFHALDSLLPEEGGNLPSVVQDSEFDDFEVIPDGRKFRIVASSEYWQEQWANQSAKVKAVPANRNRRTG